MANVELINSQELLTECAKVDLISLLEDIGRVSLVECVILYGSRFKGGQGLIVIMTCYYYLT